MEMLSLLILPLKLHVDIIPRMFSSPRIIPTLTKGHSSVANAKNEYTLNAMTAQQMNTYT